MSETNYFRLIEAYFDGSINHEQKVMLENKIQTDPLLKAEFDLQQNIITGIKQARTQQLKSRLSAIDVSGSGSSFLETAGAKWLAGSAVVATVLGGMFYWYLYTAPAEDIIQLELSDAHNWHTEEIMFNVPAAPGFVDQEPVQSNKETTSQSNTIKKVPVADVSSELKTSAPKEEIVARSKAQSLITFQDEKTFHPDEDKVFNKSASKSVENANAVTETEIEFHSKLNDEAVYHYKYFNNKLYLYGDFKNEPYEIIEIHNKGKKQLFLSYQNEVYTLKENVSDISPLIKVEDEMLIMELELMMKQDK